jgi:hypothetical protein
MEKRVESLIEHFDEYVGVFDQRNLFTGPSIYFHNKTLEMLRTHNQPSDVLYDDLFFDYLYATLTAWGLHRMGPGFAKLAKLDDIKESFRKMKEQISKIQCFKITNIRDSDICSVTSDLWEVFENTRVCVSQTKIVANSKALHHIIPDLMPPIDREYTLRFFYNHTTLNQGDEVAFKEIYPHFHRIASTCKDKIMSRIVVGMNTSQTKVIDNAIVGFVLKELKEKWISQRRIIERIWLRAFGIPPKSSLTVGLQIRSKR